MERINPPSMTAPVAGLYAQIVIVPAGRLAFISGQVALDSSGKLVGVGDHQAQAAQCFRNVAAALDAVGAEPRQIARMTINVVDHRPELIEPIFGAGMLVFGDRWPITASMLLGVQALGFAEWLVEVDAIISLAE